MKPDVKNCLNCNKEIGGRAKFCSAKCKMAYRRNTSVTGTVTNESPSVTKSTVTAPSVTFPEPKELLGFDLTKTDRTFYDRAMRDFNGDPYYRFGEKSEHEDRCLFCGEKFLTTLGALRYCSYEHYKGSISGAVV